MNGSKYVFTGNPGGREQQTTAHGMRKRKQLSKERNLNSNSLICWVTGGRSLRLYRKAITECRFSKRLTTPAWYRKSGWSFFKELAATSILLPRPRGRYWGLAAFRPGAGDLLLAA